MWKTKQEAPSSTPAEPAKVAAVFPAGTDPASDRLPSADPAPRDEHSGRAGTTIGKTLKLKGEMTGGEDVHVEGEVEGKVDLSGNALLVGESGKVRAQVKARSILVWGHLEGTVQAIERTEIRKTGSLEGDLVTSRIVTEDGAEFRGSIDILEPEEPEEPEDKDEQAPPAAAAKSAPPARLHAQLRFLAGARGDPSRQRHPRQRRVTPSTAERIDPAQSDAAVRTNGSSGPPNASERRQAKATGAALMSGPGEQEGFSRPKARPSTRSRRSRIVTPNPSSRGRAHKLAGEQKVPLAPRGPAKRSRRLPPRASRRNIASAEIRRAKRMRRDLFPTPQQDGRRVRAPRKFPSHGGAVEPAGPPALPRGWPASRRCG